MTNLKIIENELVPVYVTSTGEKVVYGSELHRCLGTKSNYREWIKRRLLDIDAEESIDFTSVEISTVSGGTPKKEHILKLDTAKEMAMLERNEKGKQVRRYFIEVEKWHQKSKIDRSQLSPQMQMFYAIADEQAKLELAQKRQAEQIRKVENRVESIREVVAINSDSWRTETSNLIKKIGIALGGGLAYSEVRNEIYGLLEKRMGVNLGMRLTNKRRRMAEEGVSKTARDKVTLVDVIAEDKKLIEGYIAIVKETAIKYGVGK